MMALAGFVHSKGVGLRFQSRMKASRCSRRAFFDGKSVMLNDCLPKVTDQRSLKDGTSPACDNASTPRLGT